MPRIQTDSHRGAPDRPFVMNADLDFESRVNPVHGAEDELLARLGRRLRKARERGGLSVSEFATRARVDRTAIDAIERGHSGTTVANLVRIMIALGIVDRSDVLGDVVSAVAAPRCRDATSTDKPGSPHKGFQPASCSKLREGLCHEVLVYQAFRPLFGD